MIRFGKSCSRFSNTAFLPSRRTSLKETEALPPGIGVIQTSSPFCSILMNSK